ncbi:hypothetical protein HPB52_022787 [Rhipicephalus sanguineus]|uniref:Cytochrome P450 n=1 Tax=Rhipicephalus sanguineus TaxID=34632 RepID=A0A9D4T636_RHISA|nr:hypothetical protein HPB52_022787 [Rhipicephalus sanguineus]
MLVGNVGSFIGGGAGTMGTALEWLMVMSAAHPHQQSLVTAETDAVMEEKEPGSRIAWSDRLKMPYAQAFMWETLRRKPVNPLALMRCASDDIKLGGYFVPRGSIVIPSFWSLFNERSFWKDPEVFRPERFLSDSGHLVTKPKWLIPFSFAAVIQDVWKVLKRILRRDLPPGPRGFPFLGYLPFILKDGHWEVDALRKKYGNMFGQDFGRDTMQLVKRYIRIKEGISVFKTHLDFNRTCKDRKVVPQSLRLKRPVSTPEGMEIVMRAEQRLVNARLHEINASLRKKELDLFFAKRKLQHRIPGLMPPIDAFADSVAASSADRHRTAQDRKLSHLLDRGSPQGNPNPRQLVSEIEETYQEGTVRNFADGFISQMKNRQEANQTFTRKLLVGNVASFIGGGTGTMCTALEWLLVMSAAKPHQQNLVRAETDAVMESREPGSRITWSDRSKMPYTEAFTWETMRCKPVNPLALMRCTADDVKLGGYIVPRGSIIIPSFWSLFNEPSYWKDPEVFRPERFLSESGHLLTKPQWFIPFSAGKRSCPGESIANMVVFVYFTNILHHFIVEASTTGVQLNDEVLGITMRPKPWELVFRPRKLYR